MAEFRCYQVDAFARRAFEGNPAAVVPLGAWLADELMLKIAAENNLSETAFFVPAADGFALRWFTPTVEVPLCGHATLASAFVLMHELEPNRTHVRFDTKSGPLLVERAGDKFTMDFPVLPSTAAPCPEVLSSALGKTPKEVWMGKNKWICLFDSEEEVREIRPEMRQLATLDKSVIITAKGKDVDFVSRFFAPHQGIDEDPVTGSGHCALAPFWVPRLGKDTLSARQVSARSGDLTVRLHGDRVFLTGSAVLVKRGAFYL